MDDATDSPYQPPAAQVRDRPAVKKPAPVKAVFVGLAVDVLGTLVFQFIIGIVYGLILVSRGVTPDNIKQVAESFGWGAWIHAVSLAVGMGFSLLGGYICARIARERVLRSVTAMALLDVALAVPFTHGAFDLEAVGLIAGMVVAIFVGAWLWLYRARKSADAQ